VVNAISSTQGTSAAYQTNFANMQQMLIQQMFQAADANGNGAVSKAEFEKFYSRFMDGNSTPTAQKAQGNADAHQGMNVSGTADSSASSASATSTAAKTPTAWLQSVLSSANQNAAGQSVASQSSGSLEFIA